jgi:methylated-DNA-[protein]-cysteine S-methyltransferase
MEPQLDYFVYDTAAGDVTLVAAPKRLVALLFGAVDPINAVNEENAILYDSIIELNQYCFGQRKTFDLRLDPPGDEFEKKVWAHLSTIPYGETRTVKQVAEAVGESDEKAVLEAVNANPIPIIIPSHRVVGDNGEDIGYVGGSELKEKLLRMEKTNKDRVFVAQAGWDEQ